MKNTTIKDKREALESHYLDKSYKLDGLAKEALSIKRCNTYILLSKRAINEASEIKSLTDRRINQLYDSRILKLD